MALVLTFAGVVAIATAGLGTAMVQRQRAQLAADAAALAGLGGGPAAASRLATLNGGRMVGFRRDESTVVVDVVLGDAQASAAASDGP